MSGPIDHKVGDTVVITPESLSVIHDGNRSIKVYPSWDYVQKAEKISESGAIGVVTHRFRPGYEMTVDFGEAGSLHMKDNWVENVEFNPDIDPRDHLATMATEIEGLMASGKQVPNYVAAKMVGAARNAQEYAPAAFMSTDELMNELARRGVVVLMTTNSERLAKMAADNNVSEQVIIDALPEIQRSVSTLVTEDLIDQAVYSVTSSKDNAPHM